MPEISMANTFLESARKNLQTQEQGRVFDFIARFYEDPTLPGISLERVNQAMSDDIWSARITQDLRGILYRSGDRQVLLYAGRHDDAYQWASRRRIEPHAITGVLQIIETSEAVEKIFSETKDSHPTVADMGAPVFPVDRFKDDYLLSLGVPSDWIPTLRQATSDDHVLLITEKLPQDVGERLLSLASGEFVTPPAPVAPDAPLIASADARRSFLTVESGADLDALLRQPLEAWIRFLHPSQRQFAENSFSGPAKVTGSAGTGKTVVALHRARNLARSGKHVFLTTFTKTLCRNLERGLRMLCSDEERARIVVETVHRQAFHMARTVDGRIRALDDAHVERLVGLCRQRAAVEEDASFLWSEWKEVIDRLGIASWEAYRDADRRGRGRPLSARDRQRLWPVFYGVLSDLEHEHKTTWEGLSRLAASQLEAGRIPSPFQAVIVDEVQDLGPAAIRFLLALGGGGRDGLFLVGDAGQRIYAGGFSLGALGVNVRGRSRVLRINYRTTEQIRRAADRIAPPACDDLDGGSEARKGTVSLRSGEPPTLLPCASVAAEVATVCERIHALLKDGLAPGDIAVFARTNRPAESWAERLKAASVPATLLAAPSDEEESEEAGVVVGTMHRAKGLEFKAVFVVGCDAATIPLAQAVRTASEDAMEQVLAQERHLLYVSVTRARDQAFVSWCGEPSPFLAPLLENPGVAGSARA